MELSGYMQKVELTEDRLTVEGTNKATRVALRGKDHAAGPVVVLRNEVAAVDHKSANPLTNGRVTVKTKGGESYTLHFRRKANAEFAQLADTLRDWVS